MELNPVNENTDFSKLKMHKYDWDLILYGKPYQVVYIEDHCHTLGGGFIENCLYAYPFGDVPTYRNLLQYRKSYGGADWGICCDAVNYSKSKWGEDYIDCTEAFNHVWITRNGEKFYFTHSIDYALYLIKNVIPEHPLELNIRGFDKRCVGKKIWYRSEPAIITSYVDGDGCIIIKPDDMDKFTKPPEFEFDGIMEDYCEDGVLKVDIFSDHIWWFRE